MVSALTTQSSFLMMCTGKQITNGSSVHYHRNCCVWMLGQWSTTLWLGRWMVSKLDLQSGTPVQCAIFSPGTQGQLFEQKIEWANAAPFCWASSSTHQLLHSSEELREWRWNLPSCVQFPWTAVLEEMGRRGRSIACNQALSQMLLGLLVGIWDRSFGLFALLWECSAKLGCFTYCCGTVLSMTMKLCRSWCSNLCACGSQIMVCMQFHISSSILTYASLMLWIFLGLFEFQKIVYCLGMLE